MGQPAAGRSRDDLAERAPRDARSRTAGSRRLSRAARSLRAAAASSSPAPEDDLPAALRDAPRVIDCEGRWITPGLIDCHTHLVYAGDRAAEFEMRLAGASYEEIARAGGGILSTVRATRAASEEELVASALPRLDALIAEGVTTVEVKSGYGLELETERKSLRAARRLAERRPISVRTTFLAAHALPPEYAQRPRGLCRQGGRRRDDPGARRRGPRRRGRRLLRRHRLQRTGDRARV